MNDNEIIIKCLNKAVTSRHTLLEHVIDVK